jgi:prepilin-type N-terminal cleavage/methylation domain-containing protein
LTRSPSRSFGEVPRAGFTLLELIVILALVGIIVTIAVPRIDVARFQLDAAVQEVLSKVAVSRGQALLRQHDIVLTFDEPGDRFYVLYDADNSGSTTSGELRAMVQLPDRVKFGRGGAPAISGMTDAVPFTKVSESLPALRFHRNGSASEEGIVYLTSGRAAGSTGFPQDTRALKVERATGSVRCLSYRTLAWVEGC